MASPLTVNTPSKPSRGRSFRVSPLLVKPAPQDLPGEAALFPGWVRLLLLIGAPSLLWIGLIALILLLLHR